MNTVAFERYAPFIQKYIYAKGWVDLRDVQAEACEAILDTTYHVIIASGTASGKTEAAFFPILTLLDHNPSNSVGVIYISPLKALINDQFERLQDLLINNNIPVWPWHGDISQSVKRKAIKVSKGILQITPESLEAMLLNHPETAKEMFWDLRFVVIDEIHALMGSDRGLQVLCLLQRLEEMINKTPRRIGLSATLNDYEPAMRFLALGSKINQVIPLGIKSQKRTISIGINYFDCTTIQEPNEAHSDDYFNFIYNISHDKKCLIFANSRNATEAVIAQLKIIAEKRKEKDVFFVHHGSVSSFLRHDTEHKLRDSSDPVVTAATLTLELGIDIGDLDLIIQIGAPHSCSSFVQRLGRSGRKTGKSRMLFVDEYKPFQDNVFARIPWNLLQTIAIIQLYVEERWVEPFILKSKPFSLLAHQTLSILYDYNELTPSELVKKILNLAVFKNRIELEEYKTILKFMVHEQILQILDGKFIIGLNGEKIVNHRSFYATFESTEGYHVISKNGEIGTLDFSPMVGNEFMLAGVSWRVTEVDEVHKKIYVIQANNIKFTKWMSSGVDIHDCIVKKMRQILQISTTYKYLQPETLDILQRIRKEIAITNICVNSLYTLHEGEYILCPWCGTKTLDTIWRLLCNSLKTALKIKNVDSMSSFCLIIESELPLEEFISTLKAKATTVDVNDYNAILEPNESPIVDKYDYLIPEELRKKAFLYNEADLPTAIDILKNL